MSIPLIDTILGVGEKIIERAWPDPMKQAEEKRKLMELHQRGDLAELEAYVGNLQGQLEINKVEAAHPNLFVSGWRPAIGWTGAGAMAYQFLVYPLLIWVWATLQAFDKVPATLNPPPMLETAALFSIVTGMLGIGAQRSFDKAKGVDTKRHG